MNIAKTTFLFRFVTVCLWKYIGLINLIHIVDFDKQVQNLISKCNLSSQRKQRDREKRAQEVIINTSPV